MNRYLKAILFLLLLVVLNYCVLLARTYTKQSQAPTLNQYNPNEIIMGDKQTQYSEPISETEPGEYYEIYFQIMSSPAPTNSSEKYLTTGGDVKHDSALILSLESDFGDKSNDVAISAMDGGNYHMFEYKFKADQRYTSINLSRANLVDHNLIYKTTASIQRVFVNDQASLDGLKNIILGETDSNILLKGDTDTKDNTSFSLNKKDTFGTVFQSNGSYLSKVAFNLKIKGNAGFGSYKIELHKADYANGKYSVAPEIITSTTVDCANLPNFTADDKTWIFDLPAVIDKGTYYYVGINGSNAHSSMFNGVSLYGNKKGDDAFTFNGQTTKQIGHIDNWIYEARPTYIGTEKVLTGSVYQDMGNIAIYTYQSAGAPSDLWDIQDSQYIKDGGIFYNQDQQMVLADPKMASDYSYKINTISPISRVVFNASEPGDGYFNSIVSYSFDGSTWNIVPRSDNSINSQIVKGLAEPDYDYVINSDGKKSNTIYFKVQADTISNDARDKYYGLKDIKIEAELVR